MNPDMNPALRDTPIPPRIARLPRGPNGYPIPWFVPMLPDGTRDARLSSVDKQIEALEKHQCWVCGISLGRWLAFVLGPVSTINRKTTELASHRECAEYAVKVCPFLTNPDMARRRGPGGLPVGTLPGAGVPVDHNGGGSVLWITDRFRPLRPPNSPQMMIAVGNPRDVVWWVRGRPATAAEAAEVLETGRAAIARNIAVEFDAMVAAARSDPELVATATDVQRGETAGLESRYAAAVKLLPPEPVPTPV